MTSLVIDTNFLSNLHRIDEDCNLVEFLRDAYDVRVGVADHMQLRMMNYCTCLSDKLDHHNISDEQVALFSMTYQGRLNLEKIARDPVDLKLIVFVKNNSSIFLTCEAMLLQLSKELGLEHWCFKAAIHHLDRSIGGIFGESEYRTEQMFAVEGTHPFFHYAVNTRCAGCHDNCQTHKSPPNFIDSDG